MTEKMVRFLEAAEKDEALIKAVQDAATLEDVLALAKAKGYELTLADMRPELPVGEIDNEALDEVAGGVLYSVAGGSVKAASSLKKSVKAASSYAGSDTAASAFAGSDVAGSAFARSAYSNSALLRSILDKYGASGNRLINK